MPIIIVTYTWVLKWDKGKEVIKGCTGKTERLTGNRFRIGL